MASVHCRQNSWSIEFDAYNASSAQTATLCRRLNGGTIAIEFKQWHYGANF